MLNRQKVLIQLLRSASRSVSRFELTKWSFLLRHEYPSSGGSSFYDFVPYQYGPFSFALYQELDKLEAMSYVRRDGENSCALDADISDGVGIDDRRLDYDIRRLVQQFSGHGTGELTDYVYESYPSFTCNSRIRRLAARPEAAPAVYTAGYEGRSIDSFLNLLIESGVRRLVDVRRNPIARRYGFHKSTLNRLCERLDIEYVHFPRLGIASEKRQELATKADYRALFADYARETLALQGEDIREVSRLVAERPSVLVCMENDPEFCHRSVLAVQVAKCSGLPINNLGCSHGRRDV